MSLDAVFRECSMFADGKLCRKPVLRPGHRFGFCEEHRSHGVNCKCGMFYLESGGPGVVHYDGTDHTAFRCARASRGET